MAIQIARWEKHGWCYEVEQDGEQHFRVWGGVHDGTKWQSFSEGNQHGYKTLAGAMRVYTHKTQQTEDMLRKQGRA
jgi:hypothetical protein